MRAIRVGVLKGVTRIVMKLTRSMLFKSEAQTNLVYFLNSLKDLYKNRRETK